jgi:hypothetical protein
MANQDQVALLSQRGLIQARVLNYFPGSTLQLITQFDSMAGCFGTWKFLEVKAILGWLD